jgi:hypothetical protein
VPALALARLWSLAFGTGFSTGFGKSHATGRASFFFSSWKRPPIPYEPASKFGEDVSKSDPPPCAPTKTEREFPALLVVWGYQQKQLIFWKRAFFFRA